MIVRTDEVRPENVAIYVVAPKLEPQIAANMMAALCKSAFESQREAPAPFPYFFIADTEFCSSLRNNA